MHEVIAREFRIYGSHGVQASRYDDLLEMILSGKLDPKAMIGRTIPPEDVPKALEVMNVSGKVGITVIDRF